MSYNEQILAVIDGETADQRTVFAYCGDQGQRPLVLRRESFSPDVGWYEQSSMRLSRSEMVAIRSAMGGGAPAACQRAAHRVEQERAVAEAYDEAPATLSFSAAARRVATA